MNKPPEVRCGHEITRVNRLIASQLDLMRSSCAFDFPVRTWKTAAMTEHSVPLGHEFGSGDSDRADSIVANLQQSANLANENCDRAVALAQTLSAQLRGPGSDQSART